ncbi:class I SAM-dependent DNA methyltransferase [Virgibacillus byunsanensis]|uniref:Class I SAM-dependent DNA methyltransferase n=1 Tax=Virgibacillus byunsanensis TaxID=570945 RepID=A0ABW3LMJ9_9BACI
MAYQQMAYLYDQLMMEAPYNKWLEFTEEMIRQTGKKVSKIADLGCGTGQITTRLAAKGYQMTGVDYSIDMLSYAEQRSSDQSLSVQWIHQDLRELEGIKDVDLAVSYCDVMNYITTEKELNVVFEKVSDILNPGGLFIFDVHSMYHVENNFVNHTFGDVSEDISYIWFCLEGDIPGEMYHDLTFFVKDGNQYNRFDEYHHQQTFPIEKYQELLIQSGFEISNISADFSMEKQNLSKHAERIFIVAEKRSGK